jgi:hypothetical protein
MGGDHRDLRVAGPEMTAPTNEISQNVVGHPTPEDADVPFCMLDRP